MNKKAIMDLMLLIFFPLSFYGEIAVKINYWDSPGLYNFSLDNVFEYSIYPLIDGNRESFSRVSERVGGVALNEFEIVFDRAIGVDRLVFLQGDLAKWTGIKEVEIKVYKKSHVGEEEEEEYSGVLNLSSEGKKDFMFSRTIRGEKWRFRIKSLYGKEGESKEGCLKEIEFYLGGERYAIRNAEELKAKFMEGYRRQKLEKLLSFMGKMQKFSFYGSGSGVVSYWQKAGVKVEEINLVAEEEPVIYVQFLTNGGSEFSGDIGCGKKGGFFRGIVNSDTGERDFYLIDYVKLGEWRIGEDGNLYIKIGNENERKTFGIFIFFMGTGLGDLKPLGVVREAR